MFTRCKNSFTRKVYNGISDFFAVGGDDNITRLSGFESIFIDMLDKELARYFEKGFAREPDRINLN